MGIIRKSQGAMFNNAAQVWNHTFYWNCLKPNAGGEPSGKLADAIGKAFGSFDKFKEQFSDLAVKVGSATLKYGKFLQTCVDFFIITLAIFVMVKIINELRRKYEDKPPAATPPRQEQLLEEIRDLLKRR